MSQPLKDRESAPLSADYFIQLARVDFGVFAVLMFPELHDGKQMVPAPYVNLMAEALMTEKGHPPGRSFVQLTAHFRLKTVARSAPPILTSPTPKVWVLKSSFPIVVPALLVHLPSEVF